jgi:hypothetical protein
MPSPAYRVAGMTRRRLFADRVIFPRSADRLVTVNVTLFSDVPGYRPVRGKGAKTGSDKPYSMTSSARARRDGGISRPSDFAVFRLIASRNFEGCSIGSSAGLAPLRI